MSLRARPAGIVDALGRMWVARCARSLYVACEVDAVLLVQGKQRLRDPHEVLLNYIFALVGKSTASSICGFFLFLRPVD